MELKQNYIPDQLLYRFRNVVYAVCVAFSVLYLIISVILFHVRMGYENPALFFGLEPWVYALRFLVVPYAVMFIALIYGYIRMYRRKLSAGSQNLVVSIILFGITEIAYVCQCAYPSLILAPCFALFIIIMLTQHRTILIFSILNVLCIKFNLVYTFDTRTLNFAFFSDELIAVLCAIGIGVVAFTLVRFIENTYTNLHTFENENVQLDKDSKTDAMTGFYNKKEMYRRLNNEIHLRKNKYFPLHFAIIDLDNFKQINDTYGHATGDIVLKKLSEIIRFNLPDGCYACRYGGEEFAVIFPILPGKICLSIMDQMRKDLESTKFDFLEGSSRQNITLSCGLACHRDKAETADELFELADSLLYEAKNNGKNQIVHK